VGGVLNDSSVCCRSGGCFVFSARFRVNRLTRGCSSRPVRAFEDAVIFVLDMEKCQGRLGSLDRQMLSRVVQQENTYPEAAVLLG